MYDLALAFWMLMAIAAATEIPPLEVDADGVAAAPPSPEPPFALEVLDACERSPATWLSTPPDGASDEFLSGAPAADAVALSVDVESSDAAIVTPPFAVTSRITNALAVWLLMFSASAMPIAALPPVVSPDAVVFEVACCVAATVSPQSGHGIDIGLPVPTSDTVETLLMAIESAGAIETPPPDAPVIAWVFITSVVEPSSP